MVALMLVGILIQSCCRNMDEHKICNIRLQINAYTDSLGSYNTNLEDNIDTSYNHFDYYLYGQTSQSGTVCHIGIPFVNSAYAMQPCIPNIIDSIPRNNIMLQFDKDFLYNGNTISAGTNLISEAALRNVLEYSYSNYYNVEGRIRIDASHISNFQFDTTYYKMTLSATSVFGNSQTFEKQILFAR